MRKLLAIFGLLLVACLMLTPSAEGQKEPGKKKKGASHKSGKKKKQSSSSTNTGSNGSTSK